MADGDALARRAGGSHPVVFNSVLGSDGNSLGNRGGFPSFRSCGAFCFPSRNRGLLVAQVVQEWNWIPCTPMPWVGIEYHVYIKIAICVIFAKMLFPSIVSLEIN